MPGNLERFYRERCRECGGGDVGNVGLIHHLADCSLNPDRQAIAEREEVAAPQRHLEQEARR